MLYAKEIAAPYALEREDHDLPIYVHVDVDKKIDLENFFLLDHHNKTPVLYAWANNYHHLHLNEQFLVDLLKNFISCAQIIVERGFGRIVIGADDDSLLHKLLSPRQNSANITVRAEPLLLIFDHFKDLISDVSVSLTVEELSPGGLDPTDGIAIVEALHAHGLNEVIASCGTKDFPILVDRRITRAKTPDIEKFNSNEPALASALWLVDHCSVKVMAKAFLDDRVNALNLAEQMGLYGLIQKAQTTIT